MISETMPHVECIYRFKKKTAYSGFLFIVRAGVIETPLEPWQGPILPLNYARNT